MVHKIHGSVRYDTVVSRFGMFSIRGRGNWLRHNVGNISVLNHEGEQWISNKHAFAPGFAHVQTLCKIYADERLNRSQFTINRK